MPRECKVPGCDSRVHAKDYCSKHYQRWRTWGDPNKTGPRGPYRREMPRYAVNHRVQFTISHWWRLLSNRSTPHPHAAQLRRGIEHLRAALVSRRDLEEQ